MAGTDEDDTTPTDWWLASAELVFVVKLVGSEERAMEVMDSLLDDLAKGLIRWDCDDLVVRGDFQAYPSLRIMFAAARGRPFFWRRDERSRLNVDWPTSCAAWVGPLSGFGSDGIGNSWPTYDPCASTSLTASGVRFHHGDVMDRLVARGLMPRPPTPSPPPQEPTAPIAQLVEAAPPEHESASATPGEELGDKTTSTLEPSFPTLQMLGLKGWQQEAIWDAMMRDLCGGSLPEKLGAAELCRKVTKWRNDQARKQGDKLPQRHPSEDTCRRFLKSYRAWRAKQRSN
jgi:hypothetical protein